MGARIAAVVVVLELIVAGGVLQAAVVIGHRGNSSMAPENTLAAVTACYDIAWGVEIDPRVSADGQIVLMHDDTVDRTTDGEGPLAGMTLAEIKTLDAGSSFSLAFAGEPVPTLDEAVTAILAGGMTACLDVKAGPAASYVSALQTVKDQVEIHCFDWNFLTGVEALDPGFTLVALGGGDLVAAVSDIPDCVSKISWRSDGVTAAGVQAAHAAGIEVYAWTVNDPTAMVNLEQMGVDGIITDYPVLATQVLNQTPAQLGEGVPPRLHDDLMMNWTFDEGLGDGSATVAAEAVQGVDAVLGTGVELPGQWLGATGAKLGGAIELDGQDDFAAVAADARTIPAGTAVTISTWVKLDELPSDLGSAYGSIYDSREDAYILYLDRGAGELRFKVTASGVAARPGISEELLDTDDWHHVVGVYDGEAGVARIYYDGQLIDMHADDNGNSQAISGIVGLQQAAFGCNGSARSDYLDGKVDDTAVWRRALSQAEIRYLYHEGAGRAVLADNPLVEATAPVVRMEFEGDLQNQGTGAPAHDGTWIDGEEGIVPRSLVKEDNEHEVS